MKEGDSVRLTEDEKVLVCTFLVTSEYCLETTQQLEVAHTNTDIWRERE